MSTKRPYLVRVPLRVHPHLLLHRALWHNLHLLLHRALRACLLRAPLWHMLLHQHQRQHQRFLLCRHDLRRNLHPRLPLCQRNLHLLPHHVLWRNLRLRLLRSNRLNSAGSTYLLACSSKILQPVHCCCSRSLCQMMLIRLL